MSNFKIGQEVLIKAVVAEDYCGSRRFSIKKKGNVEEHLSFVDETNVVNPYITTEEFIKKVKELGFGCEEHIYYGFNALALFHDEYLYDGEDIIIGLDYINVVVIPNSLFNDKFDRYEWFSDVHVILDLIFKYAQTPLSYRG